MKFHLNKSDKHAINAYTDGAVVIDGETYTRSLIVSPKELLPNWAAAEDGLTAAHLAKAAGFAEAGTVVLLGMGAAQPRQESEWHTPFAAKKAVLEVMSLPAACRTYNILQGDGRAVVAALVLPAAAAAPPSASG